MEHILEYEWLVNSIASKYAFHHDIEDLKQVGMIALMEAADNFKPSFETKFSTYAYSNVKGKILEYVRRDQLIKVSKERRSDIKMVDKVDEILSQKLGRKAGIGEIALVLEKDDQWVANVLQSKEYVRSIDYVTNDDGKELTYADMIPYEEKGYSPEYLDLYIAINQLPELQKKIIQSRYFDDMTQSETSKIVDMNQVAVSREETKILKKLKSELVA